MGVEDLDLTEHRMRQEYAGSSLAYEPIPLNHFDGRAIEGVRIDGSTNNREPRQDG